MQVQESESTTSYEVNDPSSPEISSDFVYTSDLNLPKVNNLSSPKISPNFVDTNNDLNLPIVVRKGTRTCTQHPLYPLSHFVTYEILPSFHRNFLTSLNIISIPKTLSNALNGKEWKQAKRAST